MLLKDKRLKAGTMLMRNVIYSCLDSCTLPWAPSPALSDWTLNEQILWCINLWSPQCSIQQKLDCARVLKLYFLWDGKFTVFKYTVLWWTELPFRLEADRKCCIGHLSIPYLIANNWPGRHLGSFVFASHCVHLLVFILQNLSSFQALAFLAFLTTPRLFSTYSWD